MTIKENISTNAANTEQCIKTAATPASVTVQMESQRQLYLSAEERQPKPQSMLPMQDIYHVVDLGRIRPRVIALESGYPILITPSYLRSEIRQWLSEGLIYGVRVCSVAQSAEIRAGRKHLKAPDSKLTDFALRDVKNRGSTKKLQNDIYYHVSETKKKQTPLISLTSDLNAKYYSKDKNITVALMASNFKNIYSALGEDLHPKSIKLFKRRIVSHGQVLDVISADKRADVAIEGCGGKSIREMIINSKESFAINRVPKPYVLLLPRGHGCYLYEALGKQDYLKILNNLFNCMAVETSKKVKKNTEKFKHKINKKLVELGFGFNRKLMKIGLSIACAINVEVNNDKTKQLLRDLYKCLLNLSRGSANEYFILERRLFKFQEWVNQECGYVDHAPHLEEADLLKELTIKFAQKRSDKVDRRVKLFNQEHAEMLEEVSDEEPVDSETDGDEADDIEEGCLEDEYLSDSEQSVLSSEYTNYDEFSDLEDFADEKELNSSLTTAGLFRDHVSVTRGQSVSDEKEFSCQ